MCKRLKHHRHWLEEEKSLPSPLTDCQLAALRVHLTPYRPRAIIVAMKHIAAAARTAKEQFPSLVAHRRLSLQACVPRKYGVTSDCTASCRNVPNQGWYKNDVHPFWLLSRFYRSRPLASRHFVLRASANDAYALVYALRPDPLPANIHTGANLLLLLRSLGGHHALCLGKSFSPHTDKKENFCSPVCPLMFGAALLLQTGSWNRSRSTPGSRFLRLMLWWRTRRAPSTGGTFLTGVSCSARPVPRPVVLDVLELPWRC